MLLMTASCCCRGVNCERAARFPVAAPYDTLAGRFREGLQGHENRRGDVLYGGLHASGGAGRALEERGFESLWVPEHTHIPSSLGSAYPASGGLQQAYYEIMDPFLALNTAATATTKLKVGTGIALVIQRDPILTAKIVSSIDQLSAGRFLFGVGNGWNQVEVENHGTVFKTRHKLARERIEAMKAILLPQVNRPASSPALAANPREAEWPCQGKECLLYI